MARVPLEQPMRRHLMARVAALALLPLALGAVAQTQGEPAAPPVAGEWRLIVPSPPGGAPDLVARVLAEGLTRQTGRAVVVLNVPGANGEIALRRFLSEPADGQTWLLTQDSVLVVNPSYYPRMSSNVLDGLIPVAQVARNTFLVVVRPDDEIDSVPALLQHARTARDAIAYGSGGIGSQGHLLMEDLAHQLGLRLRHIPFKGNSPAAQALLGGDVRILMAGASTLPLVRSGRLRAIATTAPGRLPSEPALPALGEFLPGFHGTAWFGLFARDQVPGERVQAMRREVRALVTDAWAGQTLAARGGVQADYLDGPAFLEQILRDRDRFGAIARRLSSMSDR